MKTGYTATLKGPNFSYLLKPFLVGMTFLPLVGGFIGLRNAFRWGGVKSIVGRSSFALSLGLVAWAGGMFIWNYYLFFTTVSVPYPSLADAIFVLSWPLWTYGIWKLSEAMGVRFALRNMNKNFFILPVVVILLSAYLLVYVARGGITYDNPLKLFFDLFYPLGDIVILTVTASVYFLSRNYLGGVYKTPILMLLFGFVMNYFSDFLFSYTTTNGTYFNGHLVDFLFTTAMFVLSVGLSMLNPMILDSNTVQTKKT
ncbi:MAG: hypothetical protein WCI89_00765 [bacterium]